MKTMLVHISDIHVRPDKNKIIGRIEQLIKAVYAEAITLEIDIFFIVITGDIAFSGKNAEYRVALDFLTDLKDKLAAKTSKKIHFIVTPGNHDCDFDKETSARKMLIEKVYQDMNKIELGIDESITSPCLLVQKEFHDFREVIHDSTPKIFFDGLCWIYDFPFENYNIQFRCYNTAWISQKTEKQMLLWYPINIVAKALSENNIIAEGIVVSLFHHTYTWLRADNARDFKKYIENSSDVILTGHEHDASIYTKNEVGIGTTEYLEGGVLQEHGQEELSSFNLLIIDLENKKQTKKKLEWNGELFSVKYQSENWEDFHRDKIMLRRQYENNNNFYNFLTDLGLNLYHPRKELLLEDVFIYPNFREHAYEDKIEKYTRSRILGNEILSRLGHKYILFFGPEKCGKTSLAKTLYVEIKKKGLVPLLLSGEEIKSANRADFAKLIDTSFSMQYSPNISEKYKQLEPEKKILIIDDFHNARINTKGKTILLEYINPQFCTLIIFGNELVRIDELLNKDSKAPSSFLFKHFEILEFNHTLKNKLIEKWLTIGREYEIDEKELALTIIKTEDILNTILGKNIVPTYPIFILTLLQILEAGKPIDTSHGAYGYFYQVLITDALNRTSTTLDLDTKQTYLSVIAFRMYEQNGKECELTDEEIRSVHEYYCRQYRKVQFNDIMQDLILCNVIEHNDYNGTYRFKYSYLYYYFSAKYFNDNISNNDIKKHILEIVGKVYNENNANIIMFLSFFCKDPFIISEMLRASKDIYNDVAPIDLSKGTDFLNPFYDEIEITLNEDDLDETEHRKHLLEVRDEFEDIQKNENKEDIQAESNGNDSDNALESMRKINLAFKTIQILGQIIKNFPGSTPQSDKIEIVEECYSLGMRTINNIFILFKDNLEGILNGIGEIISKHGHIEDHQQLLNRARKIVFFMLETITAGTIKRISESLGSDKLEDTFDEVRKRNDNVVSFLFIDLEIALEHSGAFPESSLKKLQSIVKKYVFPNVQLKLMILDHLYFYPLDIKYKQKICSIVGISIKKMMLPQSKL